MTRSWFRLPKYLIRFGHRYRFQSTLLSISGLSISVATFYLFATPSDDPLGKRTSRFMASSAAQSSIRAAEPFGVTLQEAQIIVNHHLGQSPHVSALKELKDYGFSPSTRSYEIHVQTSDPSSFLLIVTPPPSPPSPSAPSYHPNSIPTLSHLHHLIKTNTSIPLPQIHHVDSSCSLVPFPYILSDLPTGIKLSEARARGLLTEKENMVVDLKVGAWLRELHDIENDWFGCPKSLEDTEKQAHQHHLPHHLGALGHFGVGGAEEEEPSYSWQESFTLFLEEMMCEAEERGEELPYEEIRMYLSRAIGFYLFDDAEVPKLVWFTGNEDAILIDVPSASNSESLSRPEPRITSFLQFTHAIYGDPLLERLFASPGPSKALLEGYGKNVVVFARQRTKRIWYEVFWGLVVLSEMAKAGLGEEEEEVKVGERRKRAKEVVLEGVKMLKDAPCY
ncbi:hypothetical protein JAAARDRAFT_40715 [Jaapia argillacea MUCL 33604]|uniref:Aminoglycoside phosphotransferase domain-containing protein n=1 Tax=Jaapia argillacea MUCL 33604 TaxID=933084 RepID=A0A067PLJ7_9AGAM|nr:hypothetical protein JAAARDRAFT_40715 [Jaapia argillacea MUCL 33604]